MSQNNQQGPDHQVPKPPPKPRSSGLVRLRFGPDDLVRGLVMAEVLRRPERRTPSSPSLGSRPGAGKQPNAPATCTGCGHAIPAGAQFCPYCRAEQR